MGENTRVEKVPQTGELQYSWKKGVNRLGLGCLSRSFYKTYARRETTTEVISINGLLLWAFLRPRKLGGHTLCAFSPDATRKVTVCC